MYGAKAAKFGLRYLEPAMLDDMSSNSYPASEVGVLLAKLTGQMIPFPEKLENLEVKFGIEHEALGYSQLNELLLLAGLDRIGHSFFGYLLHGSVAYKIGDGFERIEDLKAGIERFRKVALLQFGNVKYAFKTLSSDSTALAAYVENLRPVPSTEFESRHDPLLPLEPISPEDAFLTGYISAGDIAQTLEADPDNVEARELDERRKQVLAVSIRNQEAYYASDHMDVYVATSMREKHEFVAMNDIGRQIFNHPSLKDLRLRWFDPTQAYCPDRIDKGLAEALMLRRASCTIYLAQVSDTLGKDSELASTLAQGKPVIAYVPEVNEEFLDRHFETLRQSEPKKTEFQIYLDQLRVFDADAAWKDETVRGWCAAETEPEDFDELKKRVRGCIRDRYDRRAANLRDHHPLGIQVNLGTGVANGVLVVRNPDDCANLVRGILTQSLEFELEEHANQTRLRESISKSIFRVMTNDPMLTNTFWNFYLPVAE